MNEPKCDKRIIVPKMSSRSVIGVVGGRLNHDNMPKFDAEPYLKQCRERLETDPNYTERQFKMDETRCKVLKLPPNHVQQAQASNAEADKTWSTIANKSDAYDFEDDLFNGFDDLTTNQCDRNIHNLGGFSPDSTLDLMNLATPEGRSSFFY